MKRLPIYIILLLLVLITAVFARINADNVELDFYFTTAQAPLALWLYIALVLGAVLGVASRVTCALPSFPVTELRMPALC